MGYDQDCPQAWARAKAQAAAIPAIYARLDFEQMPERFVTEASAETALRGAMRGRRAELLADRERVGLIAAYTLTGDMVADAYAALMPTLGFGRLVKMLEASCGHGIDAVPDAPPELRAFIADMERKPEWLDMALVHEGARLERNGMANLAPYVIRGGLLATFMNKYSALPMAITGTFTDALAAKRVFETATFFTVTVMPGALDRYGAGFKAAAMVRLMHSMVRFNVMRRPGLWDTAVFGPPIPQVDQMPAGLLGPFLLASQAVKEGRTEFNPGERARVELARYRCFLLGLPEDLLGDTPSKIIDLMATRHATLRAGFDEKTCGALVRGTMSAELSKDPSFIGRVRRLMERSFSKAYLVKTFLDGQPRKAAAMGITYTRKDKVIALATALFLFPRLSLYAWALRSPLLRDTADRRLVAKLERLLASYGHADFVSDGEAYRPAHA